MKRIISLIGVTLVLLSFIVSPVSLFQSDSNLVAYWDFDEGIGTTAEDQTPNNHDATLTTAPDWVSGKFLSALDFEVGSSEYLTVSDHDDFTFTNGTNTFDVSLSLACWFKIESIVPYQELITKYNSGTAQREYRFVIIDGKLYFSLWKIDSQDRIARSYETELNTGEWYHGVATYDGSESSNGITLYLNGVQVDDTDLSWGSYSGMSNSASIFSVGSVNDGTTNFFDGIVDEVRVYSKELTQSEIQDIMYLESQPDINSMRRSSVSVIAEDNVIIDPLIEELDLLQEGNLTHPYIGNLTEDFDYIAAITFKLRFDTTMFNLSEFGSNDSLTNGINILYEEKSILDNNNISKNEDFFDVAYKYSLITDEHKSREIVAGWEFLPNGLLVSPIRQLQFYIQDNLTSLINFHEFTVKIEGFRSETILPTQRPSNDLWWITWINSVALMLQQNIFIVMGLVVVSIVIIKLLFKS